MKTTELAQQLELAAVDHDLAEVDGERNRVLVAWSRSAPRGIESARLLARLHELDRDVERLEATRHRLVCTMRGERHLRAIPGSGATKETRHG